MFQVFCSASAVERISAAEKFVSSFRSSTELLIVGSSREAADDFVRNIAISSEATFGFHRFSLMQLASRLATPRLAAHGIVPNSLVGAEALAARAVYEALVEKKLKYFSPIARFPGFARAASATIGDLRLAGVSSRPVYELDEAGPDDAALMEGFEEHAREALIGDRKMLFDAARDEVRSGPDLARHPALFLDVPVHSAAERAFVVELAARSISVLFTCPPGDLRTLENLNAVPGMQVMPAVPEAQDSSLARLRSCLFTDSQPREGKFDDTVVFFSAPGEERETIEIVRRILREAANGIPFDRMAVLLRAPEIYASLVEAAMRRGGVPAFFARGTGRPDPSGRALLALLECAAEGLTARRFAEYLAFAQVPDIDFKDTGSGNPILFVPPEDEALIPPVPVSGPVSGDFLEADARQPVPHPERQETNGSLPAPWNWEKLLVDAAVIGGKERWARRLKGLASQFRQELEEYRKEEPDSPRIEGIRKKLRNLEYLTAFVLPVIDNLASLPRRATWGEWIIALEKLAPRVLRKPERVLGILADMKPMSPIAEVPFEEVRNVLQNWLANIQQAPPDSRYGCVMVTTPEQARGRSFDVVFVPGIAERIFPQKVREDPLLLDKLRRRLSTDLYLLRDRSEQERQLLQIAIGAAASRLYLSYPRLEVTESRARVPSFYALDVARSITGEIPNHEGLAREAELAGASRLSWPAPHDPASAIDDAEYDLSTVCPLINTNQSCTGRLAYVMTLNPHLANSLRGRWARWHKKWSRFDGLLTRPQAVVEVLQSQRLASRPYSVSALQHFAVCPYRFLLSAIYRLEPREELAPLEEMDALTRGRLFHRIQAELQRELKDKGLLPVKAPQLPRAFTLLDNIISKIADESYEELAPAIDRVWLDSIEAMRADLRTWLEKVSEQDGWTPVHFEFGFGFPPDGQRDPASLPDSVTLPGGALIHGVIDLIERSDDGKTLRVTDHKTGKNRTEDGMVIGHGEYLQPVLYGLATETAMKKPVSEGRFFYCTADGGFKEVLVPLDPGARESSGFVLRTIDDGIATPFLVPAPREDACAYCDFQEVCGPYEELRVTRKQEHPVLVRLKQMRSLE